MQSAQAAVVSLEAGEIWEPRVYAVERRDKIADATVEVDAEGRPPPPTDVIEILDHERHTEGTTSTITGRAKTTTDDHV